MQIKINQDNVIPNIGNYTKIIISALITVYIFKPVIINIFPMLGEINGHIALIIWIIVTVYFKNLIDIKYKGRDWF